MGRRLILCVPRGIEAIVSLPTKDYTSVHQTYILQYTLAHHTSHDNYNNCNVSFVLVSRILGIFVEIQVENRLLTLKDTSSLELCLCSNSNWRSPTSISL